MRKYVPGGAKAVNDKLRKGILLLGFRQDIPIRKYGPGGAKAGNSEFHKGI